jgi:hypothetical protein
MMVSNTVAGCITNRALASGPTASVTFTFNQPVEDGVNALLGGVKEAFDNAVSASTYYSSPIHSNLSTTAQEHGTSFTISGTTVTISFNPSAAFTPTITGDYLYNLSYSLSTAMLQPVGAPTQAVSLSTLLGTSIITCTYTGP